MQALLLLAACGGGGAGESSGADTSSGATSDASDTSDTSGTPTTGAPAEPGPCAEPIAPVVLTSARLKVDSKGVLRDEHGRDVQLRGVNTGGRSKWAPFVPFPIAEDATVAEVEAAALPFFAKLTGWGLDTVRVPFSWEALEPTEGEYDTRYLDRYAAMVDVAWSLGLRVIVDFHQDVYASPFCGDGFPPWTLPGEVGPPRRDCPEWGLGYIINPEVQGAFDRFWADEGGIQGKYRAMWDAMAARVADHPGVLGLELINEPGWGSAKNIDAWKKATLTPFHEAMIAHMREQVGGEPLLLFNNTGVEAAGLSPTLHLRPKGENLMYAPHLYDGGLVSGEPYVGNEPEVHITRIAEFGRAQGVATLIGEFGYQFGAVGGEAWLTRLVDSLDANRVSGTLWEYSQNEELWNLEDLSIVDAAGEARSTVDVYVRPWLRAVAGSAPSFTWDAEAGAGVARWTSDGGVTELVLPTRQFPDGPATLELQTVAGPAGACYTYDGQRGELRVQAPAGAQVELAFTDG